MLSTLRDSARNAYTEAFGAAPTVVAAAPARVELLGNHTDYNGGLVLAAAIDRFTVVAGSPPTGRAARVRSVNMGESDAFSVDALDRGVATGWGRYVRGVAWALQEAMGPLGSGFDAAIAGDVPLGAGLSSSASLQAAVAMFLLGAGLLSGRAADLDDPARMELAKVLRRSENEFVGVASGLLDQFSSPVRPRRSRPLALTARRWTYEPRAPGRPRPLDRRSATRRPRSRLADGKYNERFARSASRVVDLLPAPCKRADSAVSLAARHQRSTTSQNPSGTTLDPIARLSRPACADRKCPRAARGVEALRAVATWPTFGAPDVGESHASSRDDFQQQLRGA